MTPEETKEDIQDKDDKGTLSHPFDKALAEKSAKDFADSIKSGDLYRQLKKKSKEE